MLEPAAPHDPTSTIVLGPSEVAGTDTDEEMVVSVEDVPDGLGLLVIKRGPNAGSRFVVADDVSSIGRHPDSDLFLDDVTVSRRHAEIRKEGDHYWLRDVGSLNGTYLNRERIDQDTPIANGDELQVGKFRLLFLTEFPSS